MYTPDSALFTEDHEVMEGGDWYPGGSRSRQVSYE